MTQRLIKPLKCYLVVIKSLLTIPKDLPRGCLGSLGYFKATYVIKGYLTDV
jgi:hypothetical protein